MSRVGVLVLAFMVAGCACASIGYFNVLRFQIGMDLLRGETYQAEVCIDERCEQGRLEVSASGFASDGRMTLEVDDDVLTLRLPDDDVGGSHRITFTLLDAEGTQIAALDATVEMTQIQGSGWPCGPTRWEAELGV